MKDLEKRITELEMATSNYEMAGLLGLADTLYPNFKEEAVEKGTAIMKLLKDKASEIEPEPELEPELDAEALEGAFHQFLLGMISELAESDEDRLARKLKELDSAVTAGTKSIDVDSSTAPNEEYLDKLLESVLNKYPDLLVKVDGEQISNDQVTYGVDPDEDDVIGLAQAMFEDMVESGTLNEVDEIRFTSNNVLEEELVEALTELIHKEFPRITIDGGVDSASFELLYTELSGLLHSGYADEYISNSKGLCPDEWLYLTDKYGVDICDIHVVDCKKHWAVTFIGSEVPDVDIQK